MNIVAGVIDPDASRPIRQHVEQMLMAAQAADITDYRVWQSGPIAMGLSGADAQSPTVSQDGALAVVGDMRIDNRAELASALGISGQVSDARLVLAAYGHWGTTCSSALRGDFAFALWDGVKRHLVIACDPTGQRQILVHRTGRAFAFCTRAKGLHALCDVPIAPDKTQIHHFMQMTASPLDGTYFSGIRRVRSGHAMVVTEKNETVANVWTPDLSPLRLARYEDYVDRLRHLLDHAVARRLGTPDSVAVLLSAGLDSSAVAASAAVQTEALENNKITAYTSVPRKGFVSRNTNVLWNEGPLARATANAFPNVDHFEVSSSERSLFDTLERGAALAERPMQNPSNMVWLEAIYAAMHARGQSVLLTGQMGNIHFSYDGATALAELFLAGRFAAFAHLAKDRMVHGNARLRHVVAQAILPAFPLVQRLRQRGRGPQKALFAASQGGPVQHAPNNWRSVPRRLFAMQRMDNAPYALAARLRWGIDMRDPTADQDLIEFCLRVPVEVFVHKGRPRALARDCLPGQIPSQILLERRRGYQSADWYEDLISDLSRLQEMAAGLEALPIAQDVMNIPAIRAELDRLPPANWEAPNSAHRIKTALLRAISAAAFLKHIEREQHAARRASP